MLRRIAIALAAVSFIGAASIPTGALAFGRGFAGHGGFGGGGFGHGGFGGHGFAPGFAGGGVRSFAAPGVVGAPHTFARRGFVGSGFPPRFHGHRFPRFGGPFGLGFSLGYGTYNYYGDPCFAWTPYRFTWVFGF